MRSKRPKGRWKTHRYRFWSSDILTGTQTITCSFRSQVCLRASQRQWWVFAPSQAESGIKDVSLGGEVRGS